MSSSFMRKRPPVLNAGKARKLGVTQISRVTAEGDAGASTADPRASISPLVAVFPPRPLS